MLSTMKFALLGTAVAPVYGLSLNVNNTKSIKSAAATIVYDMLKTYYTGNVTAGQEGLLPQPYYWWEAGAMWGGLVDYWAYTGDNSYTDTIAQAIISQASPTVDFMMPNQHFDLGNDDQCFWAVTAMSAVEENLPVPQGNSSNVWLELCENSFNDFASRWNTTQCNGGIKWQIFPSNNGYDYKSTIANSCFMQLSARLARYTGNITYAEWADRVFDWMESVQYVNTTSWVVNDGAGDTTNCTEVDEAHWTYNTAASFYGAAVMYNITSSPIWGNRINGLMNMTAKTFFSPYSNASDIMFETQCEPANNCDTDQYSFKAYLSRWMAKSAMLLSDLTPQIQPLLKASAAAAAQACTGSNNACGTKWYVGGYDGTTGVGQQMSAFETIQSLLALGGHVKAPGTAAGVSWGPDSSSKKTQQSKQSTPLKTSGVSQNA